jgi:hypothetical protein
MNLGRTLIFLILLFSVLGVFTFEESLNIVSAADENVTTLTPQSANIVMGDFTVVICVTVKNNNDHVEYFKISQTYFNVDPNIQWNIVWTDPEAVKMAVNVNPTNGTTNSTGDLGWRIAPGETKKVKFFLRAVGSGGSEFGFIMPNETTDNSFWPLINDPGLAASWFMPNELEILNPNLKIVSWSGTFDFNARNQNPSGPQVQGIIRAPIVPLDSTLTASNPVATFVDRSIFNAETAAWDVTLQPNEVQHFTYSYNYPKTGSEGTTGSGQNIFPVNAEKTPTTVPTPTTGSPYGLLALAVILVAAGLGYAKFLR